MTDISTVAALHVTPWNLFSDPTVVNYFLYFLGGLGAFLGPLFGVIMVDCYGVKRGRVRTAWRGRAWRGTAQRSSARA